MAPQRIPIRVQGEVAIAPVAGNRGGAFQLLQGQVLFAAPGIDDGKIASKARIASSLAPSAA